MSDSDSKMSHPASLSQHPSSRASDLAREEQLTRQRDSIAAREQTPDMDVDTDVNSTSETDKSVSTGTSSESFVDVPRIHLEPDDPNFTILHEVGMMIMQAIDRMHASSSKKLERRSNRWDKTFQKHSDRWDKKFQKHSDRWDKKFQKHSDGWDKQFDDIKEELSDVKEELRDVKEELSDVKVNLSNVQVEVANARARSHNAGIEMPFERIHEIYCTVVDENGNAARETIAEDIMPRRLDRWWRALRHGHSREGRLTIILEFFKSDWLRKYGGKGVLKDELGAMKQVARMYGMNWQIIKTTMEAKDQQSQPADQETSRSLPLDPHMQRDMKKFTKNFLENRKRKRTDLDFISGSREYNRLPNPESVRLGSSTERRLAALNQRRKDGEKASTKRSYNSQTSPSRIGWRGRRSPTPEEFYWVFSSDDSDGSEGTRNADRKNTDSGDAGLGDAVLANADTESDLNAGPRTTISPPGGASEPGNSPVFLVPEAEPSRRPTPDGPSLRKKSKQSRSNRPRVKKSPVSASTAETAIPSRPRSDPPTAAGSTNEKRRALALARGK